MRIDDVLEPSRRSLLLFPAPGARVLDRTWIESDPRPVTLLVPEGNWRQAKKVLHREPALKDVDVVALPEGEPTRYRLRRNVRDDRHVSTIEAIARSLRIIEDGPAPEALEHVFRRFVDRVLFTRGELGAGDVEGGLPARSEQRPHGLTDDALH